MKFSTPMVPRTAIALLSTRTVCSAWTLTFESYTLVRHSAAGFASMPSGTAKETMRPRYITTSPSFPTASDADSSKPHNRVSTVSFLLSLRFPGPLPRTELPLYIYFLIIPLFLPETANQKASFSGVKVSYTLNPIKRKSPSIRMKEAKS